VFTALPRCDSVVKNLKKNFTTEASRIHRETAKTGDYPRECFFLTSHTTGNNVCAKLSRFAFSFDVRHPPPPFLKLQRTWNL
jgi:hypothetical protein